MIKAYTSSRLMHVFIGEIYRIPTFPLTTARSALR